MVSEVQRGCDEASSRLGGGLQEERGLGAREQPDGCYKQWECLVESVQRMGRGWVAPRGASSGGAAQQGAMQASCHRPAMPHRRWIGVCEASGERSRRAAWRGAPVGRGAARVGKGESAGGCRAGRGQLCTCSTLCLTTPTSAPACPEDGSPGAGPPNPALGAHARPWRHHNADRSPPRIKQCMPPTPHVGGEFVGYVAGEAPSCPAACTRQSSCQRFACFEPLGFPTPVPHPRVGSHPLVLRFTSAQGASSSRWGGPAWWGVRRAGQQTEACGRDDRRDMARA